VTNPRMIVLAREATGLTQAALAHAAGVTQAHMSKVENGLEDPSPELLRTVARECDVPVEFFEQTDELVGQGPIDLFHKKRATLPAKPLKRAHALLNLTRLEILRLLRTIELTEVAPFPVFPMNEYQEPEEIARNVRAMWRVPNGPLPNLISLIEATGTPVLKMNFEHEKLFAIAAPGPLNRHIIALNGALPASAQRFALAHELGHLVMHQVASSAEDAEAEAQRFASALLMPADDIRPQLQGLAFADLGRLKPVWRVSLAALIRRAHDLRTITDRQYRTFNMRLNKLPHGRKHEPGEFQSEEPRLLQGVIEHYLSHLGYHSGEVARVMVTTEESMKRRYFREPQRVLRPVGRTEPVYPFPVRS
jgi:Zn-dependent peptidase ImmA (M78 family)/DNA-binding XRE family transcriptional regulator